MRTARNPSTTSRMLRAAAIFLASAAFAAASACAPRPPRTVADFPAARVLAVTPGPEGGSILIESSKAGRASVHVGRDACVLMRRNGGYERVAFGALAVGQTVDVWTTGQIAESYPVQTWATTVLITGVQPPASPQ